MFSFFFRHDHRQQHATRHVRYAAPKRKACLDDPSIALFRARQVMCKKQPDLRFKVALRPLHRWREDADAIWSRQLVTLIKEKKGLLSMRGFRLIAIFPTIFRLYSKVQQSPTSATLKSRRVTQSGDVPGWQALTVEQATEWQMQWLLIMSLTIRQLTPWRPSKSLRCWSQRGSENTGDHTRSSICLSS